MLFQIIFTVEKTTTEDKKEQERTIRPSKSDTSLTDSFVVVDNDYKKRNTSENILRKGNFNCTTKYGSYFYQKWIRLGSKLCRHSFAFILSLLYLSIGFKWQRQLVFRSKLTMHTAYDRKDNAEPASITALTVSKDHKVLYIGMFTCPCRISDYFDRNVFN